MILRKPKAPYFLLEFRNMQGSQIQNAAVDSDTGLDQPIAFLFLNTNAPNTYTFSLQATAFVSSSTNGKVDYEMQIINSMTDTPATANINTATDASRAQFLDFTKTGKNEESLEILMLSLKMTNADIAPAANDYKATIKLEVKTT